MLRQRPSVALPAGWDSKTLPSVGGSVVVRDRHPLQQRPDQVVEDARDQPERGGDQRVEDARLHLPPRPVEQRDDAPPTRCGEYTGGGGRPVLPVQDAAWK